MNKTKEQKEAKALAEELKQQEENNKQVKGSAPKPTGNFSGRAQRNQIQCGRCGSLSPFITCNFYLNMLVASIVCQKCGLKCDHPMKLDLNRMIRRFKKKGVQKRKEQWG